MVWIKLWVWLGCTFLAVRKHLNVYWLKTTSVHHDRNLCGWQVDQLITAISYTVKLLKSESCAYLNIYSLIRIWPGTVLFSSLRNLCCFSQCVKTEKLHHYEEPLLCLWWFSSLKLVDPSQSTGRLHHPSETHSCLRSSSWLAPSWDLLLAAWRVWTSQTVIRSEFVCVCASLLVCMCVCVFNVCDWLCVFVYMCWFFCVCLHVCWKCAKAVLT